MWLVIRDDGVMLLNERGSLVSLRLVVNRVVDLPIAP